MRILLALSLLILLASCKGNVTTSKNTKVNLDSLVQLYPDSVPLLVTYGRQLLDDYQLAEALNYGAKAFRLYRHTDGRGKFYRLSDNANFHRQSRCGRQYKILATTAPRWAMEMDFV